MYSLISYHIWTGN